MPLEIRPCTNADLARAVVVEKAAYADADFSSLLFPGPFPTTSTDKRAEELAQGIRDDPTTVWMTVVDTDNPTSPDEGIAFSRWHIYKDAPPGPRHTREFGSGCNVPACEAVFHGLRDQRARVLGDTKCVYLQILVTHPEHQRRGAGSLLLQWGADKAKELGLPMYLESSTRGHELYKKFGFEDMEMQSIDMAPFGGEGFHQTYAMMAKRKE